MLSHNTPTMGVQISTFNFLTLNGFYKGLNEDISWHTHESEEASFSEEGLSQNNTLLLGRVTYKMMLEFWTSKEAFDMFPEVAKGMNNSKKIVFSNTLKCADWENTTLYTSNLIEQIRSVKESHTENITILGSGSLVQQLTAARLIDSYGLMYDPVIIPNGSPLFVNNNLGLKLVDSRVFKSGKIFLSYKPLNSK